MAILKNAAFHSKDSLAFHAPVASCLFVIVFAVSCQVTLKFTTGE